MRSRLLTLLCFVAVATGAGLAEAGNIEPARTAYHTHNAERFKTLPIRKDAGADPKVLVSVPPDKVGEVRQGDIIRAQGEFEMTICMKAGLNQPPQPCVGSMYPYNPRVYAQIFLSPTLDPEDPGRIAVSGRRSLACSQKIPHRNRHCVLTVPEGRLTAPRNCLRCHLLLVVSAAHPNAGRGDVVTMGSFDDNLNINQNRAGLSMARMRGASFPDPRETRGVRNSVPVVNEGRNLNFEVVYSLPIRSPRAGEAYYVESQYVAKVDHLPYNAALRSKILLARGPEAIEQTGMYGVTEYPAVSPQNGWTCTQGDSAHESPCVMRKGGVLVFDEDSNDTYYLNLIVASEAQLLDYHHYRSGSKLRFNPGYLRVFRFLPQ